MTSGISTSLRNNLQGDVIAIYTTSGAKLVSYTYDALENVSINYHIPIGTLGAGLFGGGING